MEYVGIAMYYNRTDIGDQERCEVETGRHLRERRQVGTRGAD